MIRWASVLAACALASAAHADGAQRSPPSPFYQREPPPRPPAPRPAEGRAVSTIKRDDGAIVITLAYDKRGYPVTRKIDGTWSAGSDPVHDVETLTWDAAGHLFSMARAEYESRTATYQCG